jgi:hypothetical protein
MSLVTSSVSVFFFYLHLKGRRLRREIKFGALLERLTHRVAGINPWLATGAETNRTLLHRLVLTILQAIMPESRGQRPILAGQCFSGLPIDIKIKRIISLPFQNEVLLALSFRWLL